MSSLAELTRRTRVHTPAPPHDPREGARRSTPAPPCDPREGSGEVYPATGWYNEAIRRANDLLLYGQFDGCLELCRERAAVAKNFREDPSSAQALQSLVTLAVQALAEQGAWAQVIPLVTQLYDGLEDCPADIATLCLLLHLHLGDLVTCSVVAGIWLRHAPNAAWPGYTRLVDLYVGHVLVGGGRWGEVRPFLESCPGLDPPAREQRCNETEAERRRLQTPNDVQLPTQSLTTPLTQPYTRTIQDGVVDVPSVSGTGNKSVRAETKLGVRGALRLPGAYWVSVFARRLYTWLHRYAPLPDAALALSGGALRSLCLLTALLFILYTRRQQVMSSSVTLRLRAVLRRLWKGMFAPFYDINR